MVQGQEDSPLSGLKSHVHVMLFTHFFISYVHVMVVIKKNMHGAVLMKDIICLQNGGC